MPCDVAVLMSRNKLQSVNARRSGNLTEHVTIQFVERAKSVSSPPVFEPTD